MKAIQKPIECEVMVFKPTVESIMGCKKFITSEAEKRNITKVEYLSLKDDTVNEVLKDCGLKWNNILIPYNTVIIKENDYHIRWVTIDKFKSDYNIVFPIRIQELKKKKALLSQDAGFMGSPEYSSLCEELDSYNKSIEEFLNI